ncbi:MAG: hypothetical protein JSU77_10455 [Fidelibacterota bacterium]|nr:MAG: hypothetical protein JSU77_10455 [Candidatus Neomarinimicrobiota bacterium]
MGYTLSAENVLPMLFFRRGLTDNWDLGLRLGLPIYGSGIDISRLLVEKNERSDVLNLACSLNPNYNLDFTYYRVSHRTKVDEEKKRAVRRLRYYGLRGMFIPNGIGEGRSARIGILIGGAPAVKGEDSENLPRFYRFQWEIGYFHDFSSMPLRAVLSPLPFDKDHELWDERFADYPHTTDSGLPSEHHRLTGLSIRISFPLGKSRSRPVTEEGGS